MVLAETEVVFSSEKYSTRMGGRFKIENAYVHVLVCSNWLFHKCVCGEAVIALFLAH